MSEVITIQQTSKPLKKQYVISVGLIAGGMIATMTGTGFGVVVGPLAVLGGFVWYAVTRVRVWWNHG